MAELSKQKKKARLKQWRTAQNRKYILSKAKVQKLFYYLETQLEKNPLQPYPAPYRAVA